MLSASTCHRLLLGGAVACLVGCGSDSGGSQALTPEVEFARRAAIVGRYSGLLLGRSATTWLSFSMLADGTANGEIRVDG